MQTLSKLSISEVEQRAAMLMEKARAQVMMKHPMYAALMMRLKTKQCPRAKTMYVDGRSLGYNAPFVIKRTVADLEFIYAHEITHCALGHPFRTRDKSDRDLWNQACDHAVNLILKRDPRLTVPADALCDPKYERMSADAIYALFSAEKAAKEQQPQEQQQQEQPQEQDEQQEQPGLQCEAEGEGDKESESQQQGGSQQGESTESPKQEGKGEDEEAQPEPLGPGSEHGDVIAPGEAGDEEEGDAEEGAGDEEADQGEEQGPSSESGEGSEEEEGDAEEGAGDEEADQGEEQGPSSESGEGSEEEQHDESSDGALAREWAEALSAAAVAGDEGSEAMERAMREVMMPKRGFYEALARFVSQRVQQYEDWSRRNRRFSDIYMPSRGGVGFQSLVFALDTSASLSAVEIAQFAGVVQAVFDEMQLQHATVMYCDTKVRRVDEFDACPQFDDKVPGGGGTFFSPVFERVQEMIDQGGEVACVVYLTDQDNFDDSKMWQWSHIPTLWVNPRIARAAPFGETCSLLD